jgi:hypothetical protein
MLNTRMIPSGTAAPVANSYVLDRWRVIGAGQTATWSPDATGSYMTVTCPAGGWETVIDGQDVTGGQYVVNWQGTATCLTARATPISKGQVISIARGQNLLIGFYSGTLALPQVEPGTVPTSFEWIPASVERARCASYYMAIRIDKQGYNQGGQNSIWGYHFTPMRVAPTTSGLVRGSVPGYANVASPPTFFTDIDGLNCTCQASATGPWFVVNYILGLSADL